MRTRVQFSHHTGAVPPRNRQPPKVIRFRPRRPLTIQHRTYTTGTNRLFKRFTSQLPNLRPNGITGTRVVSFISHGVRTMRRPATILTRVRTTRPRRIVPLKFLIHVGGSLFAKRKTKHTLQVRSQQIPIVNVTRKSTTLRTVLFTLLHTNRMPMVVSTHKGQRVNLFRVQFRLFGRHVPRVHRVHRTALTMLIFNDCMTTRVVKIFISRPLMVIFRGIAIRFTTLQLTFNMEQRHNHNIYTLIDRAAQL